MDLCMKYGGQTSLLDPALAFLTPCFRSLWVAVAMGDPRYGGPSLWRTGTAEDDLIIGKYVALKK